MAKKRIPPVETPSSTDSPAEAATKRQAVVRPARCPACKSTAAMVARKMIERPIAGQMGGEPYDRVIWRRLRCRGCGQLYTARFYEFSGNSR